MPQTNTQPRPAVNGSKFQPTVTEQPGQYLTFTLGSEVFALGILAIKEIIEYLSLTTVPMMPPYVRGVINLRGAVVPVIDLSIRFSRPPSPVTRKTCIVIVEISTGGRLQDVGLVVDAVDSVLDISGDDIEAPPAFGAHISTEFIQGMGKVNGRFLILLDVDSMLAAEEAALLQTETDQVDAAATMSPA
jgi:purine-binding chemotaxis protein CheW